MLRKTPGEPQSRIEDRYAAPKASLTAGHSHYQLQAKDLPMWRSFLLKVNIREADPNLLNHDSEDRLPSQMPKTGLRDGSL